MIGPSTIQNTLLSAERWAAILAKKTTPAARATWAPSAKLTRSRPSARPTCSKVTMAAGTRSARTTNGRPTSRNPIFWRATAMMNTAARPILPASHGTGASPMRQRTSQAAR